MEFDLLLKDNRDLKDNLDKRLKRYGLKIMPSAGCEKHGPHSPEMNYQVFIVFVKEIKKPKEQFWVVMYPRRIYLIEDPTLWWKIDYDNQIELLKHSKI